MVQKHRRTISFLRNMTTTEYEKRFCSVDSNLKEVKSMAKLFATVMSERTSKHQIANKELEVKIYYGSKENSKLLAAIYVFPNNSNAHEVPKFFMDSIVEPIPVTFKPLKETVTKQC